MPRHNDRSGRTRWGSLVLAAWFCSCGSEHVSRIEPPGTPVPPEPIAVASVSASASSVKALPVPPQTHLLIEAEDFIPEGNGWRPGVWGENYFASTFADTFLSRKAFLGAAPKVAGAVARFTVQVPEAGRYLPMVRYEAPFRFDARFRFRIEQQGKTRLDRVYGARESLKVWPFNSGVATEKIWPWGASENIVWEGQENPIELEAGPATLTLVAEEPRGALAAQRNVDAILLTRDLTDVSERISKEKYLPLDGLLTQVGDLYVQAEALENPQELTIPPGVEHSPYWVHRRSWKPIKLALVPGEPSGWIEVGSLLDTLNDGQWRLRATPKQKGAPVHMRLVFAVPGASGPEEIARFEMQQPDLELWFDASTRKTRKLRLSRQVLFDLLAYLKQRPPPPGRAPSRTLIYANTFRARPGDDAFEKARQEFVREMGITAPVDGSPGQPEGPLLRGVVDLRNRPVAALEEAGKKLVASGEAARIAVVSMGDEIRLKDPDKKNADELFRAFLRARKIRPESVDPASRGDLKKIHFAPPANPAGNPRLHYYTSLFRHDYGLSELKERTQVVQKYLPGAQVGANFSPHMGAHYLGSTYQWIHAFRRGALSMPWGEDYAWQVPVASPQLNSLSIDIFRAAIRHRPDSKIHYYVMPHAPGTTPKAWRRQFFADIAHGVRVFNLFDFVPLASAYTENYVEDFANFEAVRKGLFELGSFEDVLQTARPSFGQAALWFSETADVWNDHMGTAGAELRSLYLALRQQHTPLDVVIEEDALDRTLDGYRVIFLVDRHVSQAATQALTRWVERGGTLIATAGAGLRDEFDLANEPMKKLLGVEELGLDADATLVLEKQDLPFVRSLGRVLFDGQPLDVPGARGHLRPSKTAEVELRFEGDEPALIRHHVRKGEAISLAFLPGLTGLRGALPRLPVDRAPRDDSMALALPGEIASPVGALLRRLTSSVERPVETSSPRVEATLLRGADGWLVPLIDWTGKDSSDVQVTLPVGPFRKGTTASGRPVTIEEQGGKLVAKLRVEIADTLVLR